MSSLKSLQFAPIVKQWSSKLAWQDRTNDKNLDHTVTGEVSVQLNLTSDLFPHPTIVDKKVRKRFINLDLHGSEMGVGPNIKYDQNDIRGPYITRVAYQAWIQKAGEKPDPDKHIRELVRHAESPETDNSSGSVSSSMSYSINGSAGLFGATPTANVGGGVNIGHQYNHSIKDFSFYNRSQDGLLYHTLEMSSTGDGNSYSSPKDLIDSGQSPFVGARLHSLPALSKSNVPIIGQVVWMNQDDTPLSFDDVVVHLTIRASYAFISAAAYFLVINDKYSTWDGEVQMYSFPIKYSAADMGKT